MNFKSLNHNEIYNELISEKKKNDRILKILVSLIGLLICGVIVIIFITYYNNSFAFTNINQDKEATSLAINQSAKNTELNYQADQNMMVQDLEEVVIELSLVDKDVILCAGMTQEDVKDLLGTPHSVNTMPSKGNNQLESWGYKLNDHFTENFSVTFLNGKITSLNKYQ